MKFLSKLKVDTLQAFAQLTWWTGQLLSGSLCGGGCQGDPGVIQVLTGARPTRGTSDPVALGSSPPWRSARAEQGLVVLERVGQKGDSSPEAEPADGELWALHGLWEPQFPHPLRGSTTAAAS